MSIIPEDLLTLSGMADGAAEEKFQIELQKVIANILDRSGTGDIQVLIDDIDWNLLNSSLASATQQRGQALHPLFRSIFLKGR
jgi:hypothetical protein